MLKIAFISVLAAGLGACTTQSPAPATLSSLEAMASTTLPAASRQRTPISDERALVRLPPIAGPIISTRGDRFANGFHQIITFGDTVPGQKQNTIDLRLRLRANGSPLETLAVEQPTQAMIRDELALQFPKMEMRIVDKPRRNAAGIYGLAVGRWDNGTRCIYAWQWIDVPASIEASSSYDAASLRIRICGINVTLDSLAELVDDLQLSPASIETAPSAAVATRATIEPRRASAAMPDGKPQHHAAVALRHRDWDAAALSRQPAIPVSEHSARTTRAALDPTLPVAAFRGPVSQERR